MNATAMFAAALLAQAAPGRFTWDQESLERGLLMEARTIDAPEKPWFSRDWDALKDYRHYIEIGGWTTNRLVESLIYTATNNLQDEKWADDRCSLLAEMAFGTLNEINLPMVTNFFRSVNTNEMHGMQKYTLPGMIRYTNLEPEVMDYMRSLCVMTNIYDRTAFSVVFEMFDCLESMADELKPAATNRLARFVYSSSFNVTDNQGYQDMKLSGLVPAYSNSVQRLELMRYVAATATNNYERTNASNIVLRLSAVPQGGLNDLPWLPDAAPN